LYGAFGLEEQGDEGLEVFHVGAKDDGFAGEGGFGGVLAAVGEETFADDDDVAEVLPGVEFAGGVDEEGVLGGEGARGGVGREGGAEDGGEADGGEFFDNGG
jgi:hypothetical protein